MYMQQHNQQGLIHPLLLSTIVLAVFVVGLGAFGIWSFLNYQDQKNNVDAKVTAAVADAKRQQSAEDEQLFAEREKEPTRQLVGPEDLGRVTLNYPKTWSVLITKDGSNNQYEVYMNPGVVLAPASKNIYALRVIVEGKSYESIVAEYQDLVKKGDLKATPIAIEGKNGTRLDGNFSKDVQGSMVIFKVRDKTLRVFSESRTFQADFDNIILKSLKFNT